MDRGAWWAAVHGVVKSRTRLSDFTFTFHFHPLEKEMATHSSVLAWTIPGMEAWWAAVYGVAQSRTRLKRLSSSSSSGLQAPTCSWLAWSFPSLLLSSLFLDIPTWWFTFYRASSHPHPQGLHIHCPSGLLPEQA